MEEWEKNPYLYFHNPRISRNKKGTHMHIHNLSLKLSLGLVDTSQKLTKRYTSFIPWVVNNFKISLSVENLRNSLSDTKAKL